MTSKNRHQNDRSKTILTIIMTVTMAKISCRVESNIENLLVKLYLEEDAALIPFKLKVVFLFPRSSVFLTSFPYIFIMALSEYLYVCL